MEEREEKIDNGNELDRDVRVIVGTGGCVARKPTIILSRNFNGGEMHAIRENNYGIKIDDNIGIKGI